MVKVLPVVGMFGLVLAWAVTQAGAQEEKITLDVVKYDGLKEAVLRNRGKVVVVDFWADFCPPCKQNMPHLVAMGQKYAGKGLEVITVSIDQLTDGPEVKDRALKFLKSRKVAFTNLLLDEPPPLFEQKLHFKSIPTVFVFDRRGRWVQFTDDVDPERIEKQVVSMLSE